MSTLTGGDIYHSDPGVNTDKQSIYLSSHRDPDLTATQLVKNTPKPGGETCT